VCHCRKCKLHENQHNLPMTKKRRIPKKRQQTWKAKRYRSRRQPAQKPNQSRAEPLKNSVELSKRQLKDNHSLHSQSTVQDIKDFLSNVSRAHGNESLFIHTEPITYSSGKEKRQLKHLQQFQERDIFNSWTRKPLERAIGAIYLIGLFTTWIDTWVGRTKAFKKSPLHVWAAAL
jgi:hypothetical protein